MAPRWPSMYDPGLEITNIQGREPIDSKGYYLYHPHDVFRFTLYWNLLFHTPIFLGCAIFAFLNITFPPPHAPVRAHARPLVLNRTRSHWALTAFILGLFFLLNVGALVLGSVVAGYLLVALFRAGGYNMSTWAPFLWSALQVMLSTLELWPSAINTI